MARTGVRWFAVLVLVLGTAVTFVAYLLRPMSNDVRVNFAGIHEALDRGWLDDVVSGWNFRPVGYRLWLAGEHAVVGPFTTTGTRGYEIALHFVGGSVLLAAAAVAAWGWRRTAIGATRRSAMVFGAVVFVTIGWSVPTVPLQAEELAVVLTIAAWGLVSDSRTSLVAAVPAAWLPFVKGSTAALVFVVLARIWTVHGGRSRVTRRFIVLTVLIDALAVALLLVFAPSEIRDLIESGIYQGSIGGLHPRNAVEQIVTDVWAYAIRHPALYAGAIASLFLLADARRRRRPDLVVGWMAALFIFVLGRASFTYHFAIAMIPAALALGEVVATPPRRLRPDAYGVAAVLFAGVLGTATTQRLTNGRAQVVVVVIITAIWLPILVLAAMVAGRSTPIGWRAPAAALMLSAGGVWAIADLEPWSRPLHEAKAQNDRYRSRIEAIERRFLRGHDEVLLLAYGTVAYHLDVTASACRHYFPIPLQRAYRDGVSDTRGYQENLDCALSYPGGYVVLEPTWIDTTLVPELDAHLEEEFIEVARRRARRSSHRDQLVVLRRRSSTPSVAPDPPP